MSDLCLYTGVIAFFAGVWGLVYLVWSVAWEWWLRRLALVPFHFETKAPPPEDSDEGVP